MKICIIDFRVNCFQPAETPEVQTSPTQTLHSEVTLPVRYLQVALHRLEECAWRVRSRGGA